MRLYQRPDCPFCWKVRLAAAELGVELEEVASESGNPHPDVRRLSPTGTVPVLCDGGLAIWESAVICAYLDDVCGGALYPQEPAARSRVRLLECYSDRLAARGLRDAVFELRSRPAGERDETRIAEGIDSWRETLAHLAVLLGEGSWFEGPFSAADCALAARFGTAQAYGIDAVEDFANLAGWFRRVRERASWEAAYPRSFIGLDVPAAGTSTGQD